MADGMPIVITLEPGTYFRCTCGRSAHLPFCDGSHPAGARPPLRFELTARQQVRLCGCDETATAPFCDGHCGRSPA